MAIAALVELDEVPAEADDLLEMPWPRPRLRVLPVEADDEPEEDADEAETPVLPAARVRLGIDVAARRAVRSRMRRRRRRLVLGVAAAALVAGLALPLSMLGGATPHALRVPGTSLTGAAIYVVQPGDTLWSIAARFDRGGDPRPLAEALAKETGSAAVVPGERIAIP